MNCPFICKCNKESCKWNIGVFIEYTMVRKGWFHCIWVSCVLIVLVLVYFVLKEMGIEL